MVTDNNYPFFVSLRTLNYARVFPFNDQNMTKFHVQNFLLRFISLIFLSGTLYHMVNVIDEDIKEIGVGEDLYTVLGGLGLVLANAFFTLFSKKWMSLFENLVNFDKYGQPINFNEVVKSGNFMSAMCQWYVLLSNFIYYAAGHSKRVACYQVKKQRNLDLLVCEMFLPMWLPFQLYKSIVILLGIIQNVIVLMALVSGISASVVTWEAATVLGSHVDHLNQSFIDIIADQDSSSRKDKLRVWIQYHNHITSMMNQLSVVVKRSVGHAVYMTAVVCGCCLVVMTGEKPICGLLFLIGWMYSVLFLCTAGQIVIDKSSSVADTVYDSEWYNMDAKIKKDILFILMRSQRPNYVETFPFGTLNYTLFLSILNASYSYLALLKQSI